MDFSENQSNLDKIYKLQQNVNSLEENRKLAVTEVKQKAKYKNLIYCSYGMILRLILTVSKLVRY